MTQRRAAAGFTYLGILLMVALMGGFLGAIGEVWRTAQLREAERDLRFVGEEFRRAIGRYYEATPGPAKLYPRSLNALLLDNRTPGIRRYLRRIYRDPITLSREWGLIEAPDGGIAGVYSLSDTEPVGMLIPGTTVGRSDSAGTQVVETAKPSTEEKKERKPRYSDWKFVYTPAAPPSPPPGSPGAAPPAPGAPPTAAPPAGAPPR